MEGSVVSYLCFGFLDNRRGCLSEFIVGKGGLEVERSEQRVLFCGVGDGGAGKGWMGGRRIIV